MIMAGLAIYQKVRKNSDRLPANINLAQPQGSFIADIINSDGTTYILVKGGKKSDRLIAIDNKSQTVSANINLH